MNMERMEAVVNTATQMKVSVKTHVVNESYCKIFIGRHWFLSNITALGAITNEFLRIQNKWSKPSKKSKK